MANQADYEIGDRVHHFKFGAGVVVAFSLLEGGEQTIEVDFETSGKKLLSLAHVILQKMNDDALQEKKIKHHNWPESTFFNEPANQPHYMGSHWNPFCEDQAILKNLRDYLIEQKVIVRDRSKVVLCEDSLRISIGTEEENHILLNLLNQYKPL